MVLLADLTVSGCLITEVVNRGQAAWEVDYGGWLVVSPLIIIMWYEKVVVVCTFGLFLMQRFSVVVFLFLVDHCVAPFGVKNTSYL